MVYKTLGKTGLQVSSICLGTMTFGIQADLAEVRCITNVALDAGINFFDTADSYSNGESERLLGKALAGCRDQVVIASKVGIPIGDRINNGGLSRQHAIHQLECSLKNLDTDYIDLYYMHQPDHMTSIEEVLETFSILVRSGKVRYVGMSNFAAWQMCEALWKSEANHLIPPIAAQMVYNLMTRGIDMEVLPFLQAHGMGLITYNPLAGGFLTGKYSRSGPTGGTRYALFKNYPKRYWNEKSFQAVDDLSKIADDAGMGLLELSLRWAAYRKEVTSMLVGASNAEQLKENLKLIENGPTAEDVNAKCDDFWAELTGRRNKYCR